MDTLGAILDHLREQLDGLDLPPSARRRVALGLQAARQLDAATQPIVAAVLLASLTIAERVRLRDQRPRRFTDAELVAAVEAADSLAEVARRLCVSRSSITRRVQLLRFNSTRAGLQGDDGLTDSVEDRRC